MHTLSLLGEPFGTIEKFIENRNENSSKVIQIKPLKVETQTGKLTPGMESFSTENSSGSSSVLGNGFCLSAVNRISP